MELFAGITLTWLRAKANAIQDWDALECVLRNTFLPCDYELTLLDEIHNRTQGIEEKLSVYITNKERLFRSLRNIR